MKPLGYSLAAALFMLIFTPSGIRAEEIGVVMVENLNLRSSPGTQYPALARIEQGSEVIILRRESGWLQVRYQDQVGFVRHRPDYIRIVALDAADSRGKLEGYQQEVEKLHRQIRSAEEAYRDTTQKESALIDTIDDLDRSIHGIRRKIAAGRRELETLEQRIETNRRTYRSLRQRIEANDEYVAGRLVALYKLNQFGALPFLATADSLFDLLTRKKSLETILQQDEAIRLQLTEDLRRRRQIGRQLEEQKSRKQRIENSLEKNLRELALRRSKRKQILARIRSEKSLQEQAIDSLKNAALTLDRMVAELMESDSEKFGNPALTSFSSVKGLLKMPVQGKIINFFGPQTNSRFNVTVFRSGIDIQVEPGAVIQAVFTGRVMYADWFKGYGNLIIIDHGGSYYTVYAHLQELLKKTGDYVNTGEEIATVGDTALTEEPVLHFEVRHHGTPLDPMEWVLKG